MSTPISTVAPSVTTFSPAQTTSTDILETRNYINQLSDYSSLGKCAEPKVSTIVRNMAFGCGDGGKMTSFACFCSSSSSEYDSLIGLHVRTACQASAPTEESKARSLFNAYCHIPITAGQDSVAAATAADAGRVTHTTFSTHTSPTSSSSTLPVHTATNNSLPRTTVIALSVALPLLALALAAIVFLIFSRQHKRPPPPDLPCELQASQAAELSANPIAVPETEKAPPYHQVVHGPAPTPAPAPAPIQPPTSRYTLMDRKGGRDGGAVELDGSDMVFRGEKR